MLNNLKYFIKHSAIYSISNVAAKGIGVILLPLYSSFITVAEFGILGILEVTIAIFTEVVNLGLAPALVMLNNIIDYRGKQKSVFFTIFVTSTSICAVFIVAGNFVIPAIAGFFGELEKFKLYLNLTLYIVVLRILNNLISNKLRADEKSITYTIINLSKLVLSLGFIIYFVAFNKSGVAGVLYSYIISEGIILISTVPVVLKLMSPLFDKSILKTAVKFGIPLIFSSIAMMVLNVSDRYILKFYADYRTLGLYDLGYRIAGVINMFFIMPLSLALMPTAYKIFNKEGDKRYFSKMLTYLTFVLIWSGLALSLFSKEIIKIFTLNPDYWPAYQVVPVIIFSYVFFGMRLVSMLGLYLTKHTKYVAYSTLAAALINIILNFIFIPKYGMMAAAFTTLFSFLALYFISDKISARFYKIPFEYLKITKVISVGVIFYLISYFLNVTFVLNVLIKLFLILILPLVLYLFNFYEVIEIERIKGFYGKWKYPGNWRENIKKYLNKL